MFRSSINQQKSVEPTISKQWLCISCLEPVALDAHGRCGTCGSDAVDRIINFDASNHGTQGLEIRPPIQTNRS
jgi:hypothetical protein